MEEGILKRLIKRGLASQTRTESTEQATAGFEQPAELVAATEDDTSPDQYEPEVTWGPVASDPDESGASADERR